MNIQDVQKTETKKVQISIRTTKAYSKFMGDNKISPNAVFDKAISELIKENKK